MERHDYKTQRLFINTALNADVIIDADKSHANYLLNVLRLKEDAQLLVFNGNDGEWLCKLQPTGRKSCKIKVLKQVREQPAPYDLVYLFAPLKQARLDYMAQKAVEMGAGILQPVITQHTQVPKIKVERIALNAMEAAEQCGILSIPSVREPIKLEKLISTWLTSSYKDYQLIFCDENAKSKNPLDCLKHIEGDKFALLIGPEGGFSQKEQALLLDQSFVTPIALGPRILRADTAAVGTFTWQLV